MIRKDSWSDEHDSLLAQTVLEYVRAGKSQTEAFEEVALSFERTPTACGFRWNKEVRKKYEEELRMAKAEGKNNKVKVSVTIRNSSDEVDDLSEVDDVFDSLTSALDAATLACKRIKRDYEKLRRDYVKLEKKFEERPQVDDLKNLMKLIEQARKMGLLTKETSVS